jgi:UDP-3-O-[3-hydroxymyristoyl] glucosamine N-acyltransferase
MAPPAVEGLAAAILTAQPYLYYARVAQWLNPPPAPDPGIHPSAVVEGEVAAGASIGPNVWIGPGAAIGEGVVIAPTAASGPGCRSVSIAVWRPTWQFIREVAWGPAAWCIRGR